MKSWRALLRLLEPFVGRGRQAPARRGARSRGALTGPRNAQSALDALADVEKHGLALSARSSPALRARIEDIRKAAETTLSPDMRLRLNSALEEAEAQSSAGRCIC